MPNVFLIADTHFGHANILKFKSRICEDRFLREGFKDIDNHDEQLITNWNSVVSKNDKVYHLGDVGFKNFAYMEHIFSRLNGTKVLIKGNHDNFKLSQYAKIFKDVRAYHVLDRFLLSHIPVHEKSVGRWYANIHGHLHEEFIDDPKYINVSCENINYTPIKFSTIKERFLSEQK